MKTPYDTSDRCDVLVIGGGAAGIAVASSLLRRRPRTRITIVEPAAEHYYQPGWTLVGAGVFRSETTARSMHDVMPDGVRWIQAAAASFDPGAARVVLEDGRHIHYQVLVVAAGLTLDWAAIPGLEESLGRHNVTSNYRYDTAPYTWELVKALRSGRALFTQPPMPIKCAGAPQKAMYLSADYWCRQGRLDDIQTEFHSAGAVLFGVKEFVPPLMDYIARYRVNLQLGSTLVEVDGPGQVATFRSTAEDGTVRLERREFSLLHVCPPQRAPGFIRHSALAAESGWVEVDDATLQHKRFPNIFGLGDVCSAPNAKTAAAVRKQAPVVAENVLSYMDNKPLRAVYDGYGSCPLTVERGKVVLAEFGYGGKLLPSFPRWLIDGTRPSRLSWFLKERLLPPIYWHGMLKGHEWLAAPRIAGERSDAAPPAH